jgi:carbamoylphosphate synthase small subunit
MNMKFPLFIHILQNGLTYGEKGGRKEVKDQRNNRISVSAQHHCFRWENVFALEIHKDA